MRAAVLFLVATFALPSTLGNKVQSLRGAHSEGQRFEGESARLAAWLRDELEASGVSLGRNYEEAARRRLAQEADMLERADPFEAALLRGYAHRAPAKLLIVPLVPQAAPEASSGEKRLSDSASSVVSEEVVLSGQGQGRAIRRVQHCKNGVCEESTKESALPKGVSKKAKTDTSRPAEDALAIPAWQIFSRDPLLDSLDNAPAVRAHSLEDKLDSAVADPVARFAKELRGAMPQGLGNGGLLDIFGDMSSDGTGAEDAFLKDTFPKNVVDASTWSSGGAAMRSIQSETVVQDGHSMQRTRECYGDQCVTKVVDSRQKGEAEGEKKAKGSSTAEGKTKKQPLATPLKATMPFL